MRDAARRRRHHDQLGREEQRLLDAVGDEEEHLPRLPPQLEDQLLLLLARERVERAERLVHQHHFGIARERAREADALLHAAGDLIDRSVRELLEADRRELRRARSACARAFATPRIRSPNSTFSTTTSHGISACFWNTTPRSAPGPVTGWPSSRISPDENGMNPAMHESSVVLPQPDAPSATTKSPGSSARLTSESAWVPGPPPRAGVVDGEVADFELAHRRSQRRRRHPRRSTPRAVIPAEAGTQCLLLVKDAGSPRPRG